ncbi:MAG TPA: hypothetical protein VGN14_01280 [Candidatus Elarobacter sp.]
MNVDSGTGAELDNAIDLTPSSPACGPAGSLGYLNCTITLSIPPGAHRANATTYDKTGGAAGGGAVLSAQLGYQFTVVAATANQIGFSLGGVAASIHVAPLLNGQSPSSPAGTISFYPISPTSPTRFLVYALDADANAIVGPDSPPITLTSTGPALGVAAVAGNPNAFDVTAVAYAASPTNVTATVPDVTGAGAAPMTQTLAFSPAFQTPTVACANVNCSGPGLTSDTLTAGENFYSGSFTFTSATPASCSIPSAAPSTANITASPSATPCKVTVTDDFGQSVQVNDAFPSVIVLNFNGFIGLTVSCNGVAAPGACAVTPRTLSGPATVTDTNPSATFTFKATGTSTVNCNETNSTGYPDGVVVALNAPASSGSAFTANVTVGIFNVVDMLSCPFTLVDNTGGTSVPSGGSFP